MQGGVTFEAGGAQHQLRFTVNAICRLEEKTGQAISGVIADMQAPGKGMTSLRLLFWVALGSGTLDQAGELIDEIGAPAADELLARALRAAFPVQEEDDEGNREATVG